MVVPYQNKSNFYYIIAMETSKQQRNKDLPENLKKNELVAAILRLQVPRPENWNWKEDYAAALEEKQLFLQMSL